MKRIILPIVCLVCLGVGVAIGWYLAFTRVGSDRSPATIVDADRSPVTIMPAPTGDGHVRSYSPFGLQNIAEQYLSEHHITIHRDGVAVTVSADPKQPFATVFFMQDGSPVHAVEIGSDGKVIRDYPCSVIHVK
jgi:hypothetical protein